MSNSAPPFRPRATRAELADLEKQLSRARRRLNADHTLRTLCPSAAIALGAVSALLVAALTGVPTTWFTLLFWGLAAATCLSAARAFRRLRAGWIPVRDAAVRVDHRAGLGDRLATITTLRPAGARSRLWQVLLRDNLALLPRWKPDRLVPSLASPSVGGLFAALLTFLVVLQFLPSAPALGPLPNRPGDEQRTTDGRLVRGETRSNGDSLGLLTSLPESLRGAVLDQSSRQPGRELAVRGDVPEGAGEPVAGNPPNAEGSEAFSGPPPQGGTGDGALPSGEGPAGGRDGAPKTAVPMARGENRPLTGEGFQRLAPVDPPPGSEEPRAGRNPGSSGGAGDGPDPEGLYGEGEGGSAPPDMFSFDLAAQGRRGAGEESDDRPRHERPPAELAQEQRLDDAIRRARIPSEYEEIVRRMFRREEPEP